MTDLAPAVASYLRWDVVARDEPGDRIMLGLNGDLALVANGVLHADAKQSIVTGSGIWVDDDLPSTEGVLNTVQLILAPEEPSEVDLGKKFDPHQPRDPHTGQWIDVPGGGVTVPTAAGWSMSSDDAVDQVRQAHGISPGARFEVQVDGRSMQGESRTFASAVEAVVQARDEGSTNVELRVKSEGSMTRLPTAEESQAVVEAATSVISRRQKRVDLSANDMTPEVDEVRGENINDVLAQLLGAVEQPEQELMRRPPISAEVKAAVNDRESARRFFVKRGIKLEMGDYEGNPQFWQELAQATDDAQRKVPVIKGGKYGKLSEVILDSQIPTNESWSPDPDEFEGSGVWATTSFDVSKAGTLDVNGAKMRGRNLPSKDSDAWIILHGHEGEANPDITPVMEGHPMDEDFKHGMASQPTRWVYGRFMHEIGHASSQVSGFDWAGPDPTAIGIPESMVNRDQPELNQHYSTMLMMMMTRIELTPADVQTFSRYAVHSPEEAWAEMFAILNTPGGINTVKDEKVRAKVLRLQALVNDWAVQNKVPGGRIL